MSLVPVKAAEAPRKFDLAIVGAGPAGMAAAISATSGFRSSHCVCSL